MSYILSLLLGPPLSKRTSGPVRVKRYWRELDEEVLLGVCRTEEEAATLIRADQDAIGSFEARDLFSYHIEPALEFSGR